MSETVQSFDPPYADEPPLLTVTTGRADGAVRIELNGEIDMTTAPRFGAALQAAARREPPRVEIDCTALTFMDSSGIAVIASALRAHGGFGSVRVCNPSAPVRRTLEICGLGDLVDPAQPTGL
jgi:anti-sigma B factor antagonist